MFRPLRMGSYGCMTRIPPFDFPVMGVVPRCAIFDCCSEKKHEGKRGEQDMEIALESNGFFMGIEYLAVFCSGLMGGLCAVRKNYDLFAMLITAWLTALGGGIIRDVMLGSLPPVVMIMSLCSRASSKVSRCPPKRRTWCATGSSTVSCSP